MLKVCQNFEAFQKISILYIDNKKDAMQCDTNLKITRTEFMKNPT